MEMIKKRLKELEDDFMSHIREEFKQFKGTISLEDYKEMRMNSYEQKFLEPYLSNEALVWKIENALKNSSRTFSELIIPTTYDDYLCSDGMVEILKRFKNTF